VTTPTGTIEQAKGLQVNNPGTPNTPPVPADLLNSTVPPSLNTTTGLLPGVDGDHLSTLRMFNTQTVDGTSTSNLFQANTFSALVAPALPVPTVPPPTLVDTVLALPGTFISTALNLITQALAPLIGPSAPADNPILWAVLAFVRRQFNQGFANSTPVVAPRQTSQDVDDSQVHGTFGGTDADGDPLTYTVPTTGLGAPVHGTVAIDEATGTYTYTPTAGYVGEDYFFVTATDDTAGPHVHALGQTHAAAARVDVHVESSEVNPPTPPDPQHPYSPDPLQSGDPTGTVRGTVHATDPQGLPVTYTHTGPSTTADGSTVIINTDGSFVYTPSDDARHNAAADNAAMTGADTFTFAITATNSRGASSTIPVSVPIDPTNQAPTAPATPPATTVTDHSTGTTTGTVGYTDADNDALTYTGPAGGHTTGGGTITVNPTTGAYTYTPDPTDRHPASAGGTAATDSFDVTVTDGHGSTQTVTVHVPIDPTNQAPTAPATPPATTVTDHSTGTTTGTVGYTDADNGGGTITVNPNGGYTYTPDTHQRLDAHSTSGDDTDSFDVVVTDGHGSTQTVTVHVPIDSIRAAVTDSIPLTDQNSFPSGSAVPGPNGSVYAVTGTPLSDGQESWQVVVTDAQGHATTVPLNGEPLARHSSVPGGNLVVASNGKAYQAIANTDGTYSVVVINPDGTAATISLPGDPATTVVIGSDNRAYIMSAAHTYTDPTIFAFQPLVVTVINPDNSYTETPTGLNVSSGYGSADGPVHPATDPVVTGSGGYAYVATNNSVIVFNPNGTTTTAALPTGWSPWGSVYTGPDGQAYQTLVQGNGTRVVKINNDGTTTTVGSLTGAQGRGGVVGPGGTVTTVVRESDGTTLLALFTPGQPTTVTPTGYYTEVAGGENGIATLTATLANGSFTGWTLNRYNSDHTVGASVPLDREPRGFQPPGTDTGTDVFVTDDGRAFVITNKLDQNGSVVAEVTLINPDNTVQLLTLQGGVSDVPAVDDDGRLYFTTVSNHTVVVVDPDGTTTVVPLDGFPEGPVQIGPDGKAYVTVRGAGSHVDVISVADPPTSVV